MRLAAKKTNNVIGRLVIAGTVACIHVAAAAYHGVDLPMNLDPVLPEIVRVPTFDPRLKELWLAALDRPEAENRLQVLLALPRAVRQKMPDVDKFIPRTFELLKDSRQD